MPGWSREERVGRRQRTVYVLSDEAKQSPEVHPKAGQRHGTSCTAESGNALHANSSSQAPYHSLSYSKAKLIHYAARPLPTKSSDFAGTP